MHFEMAQPAGALRQCSRIASTSSRSSGTAGGSPAPAAPAARRPIRRAAATASRRPRARSRAMRRVPRRNAGTRRRAASNRRAVSRAGVRGRSSHRRFMRGSVPAFMRPMLLRCAKTISAAMANASDSMGSPPMPINQIAMDAHRPRHGREPDEPCQHYDDEPDREHDHDNQRRQPSRAPTSVAPPLPPRNSWNSGQRDRSRPPPRSPP